MQNHQKTNQEGYSLVGVLLSLGAATGLALISAQTVTHSKEIVNPIKKTSYIMDLKYYINNNFDCEKTMKLISCNGEKVETYRKNGKLLTEPVGTNFYRNQEQDKKFQFVVNASCEDEQFNFFYTYKTPHSEQDKEQHLFDNIPIVCGKGTSTACEKGLDTLTFEDFSPGDTIANDEFEADFGITFAATAPMKIAKNGTEEFVPYGDHAFACDKCGTKSSGERYNAVRNDEDHQVGSLFMTDDSKDTEFELTVDYTNPVKAASGIILDLDPDEEWIVKAFDGPYEVYSKTYVGNKDLDGAPMLWKVENDPEIEFDRIILIGRDNDATKGNFGLAFDNFSPSAICEEFHLP